MTQPLTLYLPLAIFEKLHRLADGRGKFCKVSKRDLAALLMDHASALAKLADVQVEMEESYATHSTIRQAGKG